MLFLSRFVGQNLYGVVDTDDGQEDIIPRKVLVEAVGDHNIEIAGVVSAVTTDGYNLIRSILPYQTNESLTPLQAKTHLIHNVEVKLYHNMIVNVLWHCDKIMSPVAVRLSDFGSVCADRILFGNTDSAVGKVRFLLDDSIGFSDYTFMTPVKLLGGHCGLGVTLDLHDMCDDHAQAVYDLLPQSMSNSDIRKTVLDFPARQELLLQGRVVDDEWR